MQQQKRSSDKEDRDKMRKKHEQSESGGNSDALCGIFGGEFKKGGSMVRKAAAEGANVILLPELLRGNILPAAPV